MASAADYDAWYHTPRGAWIGDVEFAALRRALAARPGERVLDVGCGFGTTSLAAAALGAVVRGLDISPPMIERATTRAAGSGAKATFAVSDVQEDALGGPYDLVISRFGVMFFADPVRAFRNMAAATVGSGRLAFVCWQPLASNPWMTTPVEVLRSLMDDPPAPAPAGAGPFAFGDPHHVARILVDAGWTDIEFESFETHIRMGGEGGLDGAVDHALNGSPSKALLAIGPAGLRERAATVLAERLAPFLVDGAVRVPAATWIVTAHRA